MGRDAGRRAGGRRPSIGSVPQPLQDPVPTPGSTPPPRERGLVLGRPFGVPVVVGRSWLLIAVLLVWLFEPSVRQQQPGLGALTWAVALVLALLLYASVLLHELSHTATALHLGLPVRRITLHLLGGASELTRQPGTPSRAFLVAVSGPVVNLVLSALGWIALQLATPGTIPALVLAFLAGANLLVGLFNLLPGLPLDGGRALEAVVWRVAGRRAVGSVVAGWGGRVLAVALVVTPLLLPVLTGRPADLVAVVVGLLLGAFMWTGAGAAIAAARVHERLPNLAARDLARRALPVARDTPVAEALRRAQAHGAGALVVVDQDERPTAIVHEAAVRALPPERQPWVSVADVSRRIEPEAVLDADLRGEQLLEAMRRRVVPEYLVVDADGLVFGVLSTQDVERALAGSSSRRPAPARGRAPRRS